MDMLYFKVEANGHISEVSEDGHSKFSSDGWVYGTECKSYEDAERLARLASEDLGQLFLAVDRGSHVWPRYDVTRAPKVGDPISYGFNGDYYPDGHIIKVGGTECSRVYSDTGSVYNRRRKSGAWIKRGGTWCMVQGHIDERNPSF
jgi:hypothetical protein